MPTAFRRNFKRYGLAGLGGLLIVAWVLIAIGAPLIAPARPEQRRATEAPTVPD